MVRINLCPGQPLNRPQVTTLNSSLALIFGHRTFDVSYCQLSTKEDRKKSLPLGENKHLHIDMLGCFGLPLGGQTIDYHLMAAVTEKIDSEKLGVRIGSEASRIKTRLRDVRRVNQNPRVSTEGHKSNSKSHGEESRKIIAEHLQYHPPNATCETCANRKQQ